MNSFDNNIKNTEEFYNTVALKNDVSIHIVAQEFDRIPFFFIPAYMKMINIFFLDGITR